MQPLLIIHVVGSEADKRALRRLDLDEPAICCGGVVAGGRARQQRQPILMGGQYLVDTGHQMPVGGKWSTGKLGNKRPASARTVPPYTARRTCNASTASWRVE
jgi:hypothetical protein